MHICSCQDHRLWSSTYVLRYRDKCDAHRERKRKEKIELPNFYTAVLATWILITSTNMLGCAAANNNRDTNNSQTANPSLKKKKRINHSSRLPNANGSH
ncbi:hypothetical protein BDV26DRAFT_155062 [Aspergillus bertholletiae]|uniref:Uncharacterized protein n=1 Tax=Aspergillus bertholletiae TaxID=1226010 RepID=A0A5N7BDF8_9EURO|nr:hypothetical protein BDV26DRAFT_155062 [Aspergillus bertholletiae]